MTATPPEPTNPLQEGFVEIDGDGFYAIPDVDRLGPFLMSIVSDSDHWMFVSSRGGLTAGRVDAATALFPYETDDRLHQATGITGPVTAIRTVGANPATTWRPFHGPSPHGVTRNLYKSVAGNQVIFEETHRDLDLTFQYRWANSERFGFVRTVALGNLSDHSIEVDLIDGLRNVLPYGLDPALYQRLSNLTNAYKRSEVIDPATRLAVFSLEAHVVDRPDPAEALIGSVAWSDGWETSSVTLDPEAVADFVAGLAPRQQDLVTGRPGAYLLTGTMTVGPRETKLWHLVADVHQSQPDVVELRRFLRTSPDPTADVVASIRSGTASLVGLMAAGDAIQRTGDRVATAHQFANVTYNVMRGGVFRFGYQIRSADFVGFLEQRNRAVAERHRTWLEEQPAIVGRSALMGEIAGRGDVQLIRLSLEYLPLTFSRRHGDPSRPWNAFSIELRDADGAAKMRYEGNWRDIFQNWEALCLSFPDYLPSIVATFVNASTADGFNPYRITREGIDWEVPDPDDPWSNIGYWGDHQIVYLQRLIDATRRFLPTEIEQMLLRPWFSYADVPYRIVSYDEMVRDPKATIRYDIATADRTAARVAEVGGDGRLLWGSDREVHLVTLLEKLLVSSLSKLSNYVPGGGIWMNTQRPEWNDANNALVGHGLSMVTLYYLRRYLLLLRDLGSDAAADAVQLSTEVADWLASITAILRGNTDLIGGDLDPRRRKDVMDELGWAFFEYRSRVYASGFSGPTQVNLAGVVEFCDVALDHLDDAIRRNRREDGLYQSYNLVEFSADGSEARVEHLPEMLEGQVAVLSSGVLSASERVAVIEALATSAMYRADQRSFMLYPARRLPSFLEKNVVPASAVAANPLLEALTEAGDPSIIATDADGTYRFHAEFEDQSDLQAALDRLASEETWAPLVAAHREATVAAYEEVFNHHGYTGRSGSMYGYEGLGSIYWHMVAKLLVAVQESIVDAADRAAAPDTVGRLVDAYWQIRAGLGFNKTAVEYGAFPTDPYSHTPAHAGAQQPGMTGQVKEELLTRLLEVGVRVADGRIRFDPILLRATEFLTMKEQWQVCAVDGSLDDIDLPAQSLGLTLCQVPIVVELTTGSAAVEVTRADGSHRRLDGLELDTATSRAIFDRIGQVVRVSAFVPSAAVAATPPPA